MFSESLMALAVAGAGTATVDTATRARLATSRPASASSNVTRFRNPSTSTIVYPKTDANDKTLKPRKVPSRVFNAAKGVFASKLRRGPNNRPHVGESDQELLVRSFLEEDKRIVTANRQDTLAQSPQCHGTKELSYRFAEVNTRQPPPNPASQVIDSGDQDIDGESNWELHQSEEQSPLDHPLERRNWIYVKMISNSDIKSLFHYILTEQLGLYLVGFAVISRVEGSFHHVRIVRVKIRGVGPHQDYVIKIPAHAANWQKEDGYMLRNEAELMRYIRRHTTVPVPEVIAYDATEFNRIRAPYIIMKKLPGRSAYEFLHGLSQDVDMEFNSDTESASDIAERKRINFIKSLAATMAQLDKLKFDKIGIPDFTQASRDAEFKMGPCYRWHSMAAFKEMKPFGPFSSAEEFFRKGLDEVWDIETLLTQVEPSSANRAKCASIRKIYEIILSTSPFTSEKFDEGSKVGHKESFGLRHDDLDAQNVLVDRGGNVVGIIDWDGCMAMPRCLGPTSMPKFLRRDWIADSQIDRTPVPLYKLENYCDIYAQTMAEHADARFTRKSPIHQGLLAALHEDEEPHEIIGKILMELNGPLRRVGDLKEIYVRLGEGDDEFEAYLEENIPRLLEP
ncbi:hypothetical protein BS50DRAFT_583392 [Corynespora cassiicola Philippines]|uniref:Aminoglycoside phosphotransferase domain-containing protein n=1 Tax=Corynespora cassiicola Philippines TaxID=1448308 RepID=A0A2T2P253_CORCC|nr:hypothetical protein BS50DRAFT_583392 [Corynespora cassiicola Philippines]